MAARNHGEAGERTTDRFPIARRSCDQCRSRKVGCDRGSPCANCVSARLSCTHSAVAAKPIQPRQRILISAEYERKIDSIARDIDSIKLHLRALDSPDETSRENTNQLPNLVPEAERHTASSYRVLRTHGEPEWDHSPHIIDFVKAVVVERSTANFDGTDSEVIQSLRDLVETLERPPASWKKLVPAIRIQDPHNITASMPPMEAVVAVLRWAEAHAHFYRLAWIACILPLRTFADICRAVYFAVDDYSDTDFILANAYLNYVFAEHAIVSGSRDSRDASQKCHENLGQALSALPLLLPSSREVIAGLTLGAFNAIESSKAMTAWTFISAAADHCLRLGYHRGRTGWRSDNELSDAEVRLFWVVHRIEKSLALRMGRTSQMQDEDITVRLCPELALSTRLASLQSRAYEGLYSFGGVARPGSERREMVEALALELRGIIHETKVEAAAAKCASDGMEADPMGAIFPQIETICQTSLLVLILRAEPQVPLEFGSTSDECEAVAREVFDLHELCMTSIRECNYDPFLMRRYLNWAIVQIPFIPFSILYTRAVQIGDLADLARLERFAASLKAGMEDSQASSAAHPHRLYWLLCQAARLYIDSRRSPRGGVGLPGSVPYAFEAVGLPPSNTYSGVETRWNPGADTLQRVYGSAERVKTSPKSASYLAMRL